MYQGRDPNIRRDQRPPLSSRACLHGWLREGAIVGW